MARKKEGAFIELTLKNGKYAYGRILSRASFAFYDLHANEKITDIEKLKNTNILFINSVYDHAITKNRWQIVGISELEKSLKKLPLEFTQDDFDHSQVEIYDPNTGEMRAARKSECIGLERASVWEPEHIEDRLLDHFEGRPNK